MKLPLWLCVFLLCVVAYNQWDQYDDRHDRKTYFVSRNSPYPLQDFDPVTKTYTDHQGPIKSGGALIYKSERALLLPMAMLATVTRRIVRKFPYNGGIAREPVFNYPSQIGVEVLPGESINFPHVDLPSSKDAPSPSNQNPKDLPPGDYSLEIAVSFMYHGDQRTYTSETATFRVEAR